MSICITVTVWMSMHNISYCRSENYLPFIESGKTWAYMDSVPTSRPPYPPTDRAFFKYVEAADDRMVDNIIWTKLKYYFKRRGEEIKDKEYEGILGYISEKDGRLYYSKDLQNIDMTIPEIDMNLKEGDVFIGHLVTKVDSICVNGIVRKRIALRTDGILQKTACFVEGIGADNDSYRALSKLPEWETGIPNYLMEVRDASGKVIFTQRDFTAPSYGAGVGQINDDETRSETIYDLKGNAVSSPEPGEIYIKRGKKYIHK